MSTRSDDALTQHGWVTYTLHGRDRRRWHAETSSPVKATISERNATRDTTLLIEGTLSSDTGEWNGECTRLFSAGSDVAIRTHSFVGWNVITALSLLPPMVPRLRCK